LCKELQRGMFYVRFGSTPIQLSKILTELEPFIFLKKIIY